LDDLRTHLSQVDAGDLEGLWAIGLVPSTQKDCGANARYFADPRPVIHVYSIPDTLRYRQPLHTRRSDLETGCRIELEYGRRIEQEGARWACRWAPEPLRQFILEHVLLHEIGHHVTHRERRRLGLPRLTNQTHREQLAEAYALRQPRE